MSEKVGVLLILCFFICTIIFILVSLSMMQEPYPPQKVVAATPVLVVVTATPVPESPGELDRMIVTALKLSGLALFLAIAIPVLGFILLVAVMGSRFLLLDFFRTAKKW